MKRYLVLENGTVWEGEAFGAEGETIAEVVFTTDSEYMTNLSDGSYRGQAVVQTFPLLGDYGAISADMEGRGAAPSAYIVRQWCSQPSNFRSEGTIDAFMKKHGVIGLCGIDTRALCRMLRGSGVMNGMLCGDPGAADIEKIRAYRVPGASRAAKIAKPELIQAEKGRATVAVPDLGGDIGETEALLQKGCNILRLPYGVSAGEILDTGADGVLLGGGPGDPEECTELIKTAAELMEKGVPMLGIGLGHQIMALAAGFKTAKMKSGHRGSNQPVKEEATGYVYICRQNHGYEVKADSIDPDRAEVSFTDINSGSVEGIGYLRCPALSVQFAPDCSDAPRSTGFIYDRFIALMG